MKLITCARVLRMVAVLSVAALDACGSGRSLPPTAPSSAASAAASGSDVQTARAWILAEKGGPVSLPDGSRVNIPAGLLSQDGDVTLSSAPRGPLPSSDIEAVSRSVTVSFAGPTRSRKRPRAASAITVPSDLRISLTGFATRRLSAPTAILLELSTSDGKVSFVAAPDESIVSPGQPATVSLRSSFLSGISEIRATLISVTRLTDSVPPPQYLYSPTLATLPTWRPQPNIAPHKRTLVLVHGIHATVDSTELSTFPASCAEDIRIRGNYDQVVGFNYDYALPPFGPNSLYGLFGRGVAPKDALVAFVRGLNQDWIDIEAHSYGTVVTLAALPELKPVVKNVILLAGPLPKRGLGTINMFGEHPDRPTRLELFGELTIVVGIPPGKAAEMSVNGWVDGLLTDSDQSKQISNSVRVIPGPPEFTELAATHLDHLSPWLAEFVSEVFGTETTDGAVSELSAWSTDFIASPTTGVIQRDFPTTHGKLPCDSDAKQFVASSLVRPPPTVIPSVSSIFPPTMPPDGQSHQLTINGSSFGSGNVVQTKRGQGSSANVWKTSDSTPTIRSGQITVSLGAGTVTDTIAVRVCDNSSTLNCSDGTTAVAVKAAASAPNVSSISPTSMTAGGQSQRLTMYGGPFASGNVVQFKWGQGLGAGVWTISRSTPAITSSQITVSMNAGTVSDTIFVRVCETSAASNCSDGTPAISVGAPTFLPSISSLNPASMVANGQNQTLYIYGSSFASGDIVQFKRGQGSGANVWTTSSASPTVTSSQITVGINPGTVPDTVFVRVCRASGSTCSDGTSSLSATSRIVEYSLASSASGPSGITAGPDGAVWFAEQNAHAIGRITTNGVITEYPIPNGGVPFGITPGPDGALWFTSSCTSNCVGSHSSIGRVTTAGAFTDYPIPYAVDESNGVGVGFGITAGPDGAIWFTSGAGNGPTNLTRVTTSGAFTKYFFPRDQWCGVGSSCDGPDDIASGPDGALWFTMNRNDGGPSKVGRMTTSGSSIKYGVSLNVSHGMVAGPDGALWFTEYSSFSGWGTIGRITTAGVLTEYNVPGGDTAPVAMATGSDGALWFTEGDASKIGRITTSGVFSEYSTPTAGAQVYRIARGSDGSLWFTEWGGAGNPKIGRIAP